MNSWRTRMNTLRIQLVRASKDAIAAGQAMIRNDELLKKLYARVKVIKGMLQTAVARLHTRLFHLGKTKVAATRTVLEARGIA